MTTHEITYPLPPEVAEERAEFDPLAAVGHHWRLARVHGARLISFCGSPKKAREFIADPEFTDYREDRVLVTSVREYLAETAFRADSSEDGAGHAALTGIMSNWLDSSKHSRAVRSLLPYGDVSRYDYYNDPAFRGQLVGALHATDLSVESMGLIALAADSPFKQLHESN